MGLIRYGSCDADLTYRLQAPQLHEQMEGFDDRGVGCWAVSAVHLLLHPVGDKEDGGARCRFAAWNTLEYVPDVWCWFRPEVGHPRTRTLRTES